MPTISLKKADKALKHLIAPPQGPKPPLLDVKGWDKSKVIYHLKDDIERTFKKELDRLRDLQQDAQKVLQKAQSEQRPNLTAEEQKKLNPIYDEVDELYKIEKDIELTGGKLTKEKFEDVIDSEAFIDLDFAIELNGESVEKQG